MLRISKGEIVMESWLKVSLVGVEDEISQLYFVSKTNFFKCFDRRQKFIWCGIAASEQLVKKEGLSLQPILKGVFSKSCMSSCGGILGFI